MNSGVTIIPNRNRPAWRSGINFVNGQIAIAVPSHKYSWPPCLLTGKKMTDLPAKGSPYINIPTVMTLL